MASPAPWLHWTQTELTHWEGEEEEEEENDFERQMDEDGVIGLGENASSPPWGDYEDPRRVAGTRQDLEEEEEEQGSSGGNEGPWGVESNGEPYPELSYEGQWGSGSNGSPEVQRDGQGVCQPHGYSTDAGDTSGLSDTTRPGPPGGPISFKSPAEIVQEALLSSGEGVPPQPPTTAGLPQEFRSPRQATELVQQLQDDYRKLLMKYAEAENTIDQLRLGARVSLYADPPQPSRSLAVGTVGSGCRVVALSIPQARTAAFSTAMAPATLSSPGGAPTPGPSDPRFRKLKDAQDVLERAYLQARQQHPGTSGEFDPDRSVEGEIFRLGLCLEELKERLEPGARQLPRPLWQKQLQLEEDFGDLLAQYKHFKSLPESLSLEQLSLAGSRSPDEADGPAAGDGGPSEVPCRTQSLVEGADLETSPLHPPVRTAAPLPPGEPPWPGGPLGHLSPATTEEPPAAAKPPLVLPEPSRAPLSYRSSGAGSAASQHRLRKEQRIVSPETDSGFVGSEASRVSPPMHTPEHQPPSTGTPSSLGPSIPVPVTLRPLQKREVTPLSSEAALMGIYPAGRQGGSGGLHLPPSTSSQSISPEPSPPVRGRAAPGLTPMKRGRSASLPRDRPELDLTSESDPSPARPQGTLSPQKSPGSPPGAMTFRGQYTGTRYQAGRLRNAPAPQEESGTLGCPRCHGSRTPSAGSWVGDATRQPQHSTPRRTRCPTCQAPMGAPAPSGRDGATHAERDPAGTSLPGSRVGPRAEKPEQPGLWYLVGSPGATATIGCLAPVPLVPYVPPVLYCPPAVPPSAPAMAGVPLQHARARGRAEHPPWPHAAGHHPYILRRLSVCPCSGPRKLQEGGKT
ncbi:LOW QUALITY PROTEIN: microtubule organization protein AKNA [Egretta garzetta]|uniref:LOW QUALITY PROTEIN: microtubule organization protein AKNA n=1 Tax=Egretta garzetta TaxID=188379 RepID=UPI00163C3D56|nr:LOW QUALITY PROTEIN: microtubule organization protein AKNA [Egretta garzetta]